MSVNGIRPTKFRKDFNLGHPVKRTRVKTTVAANLRQPADRIFRLHTQLLKRAQIIDNVFPAEHTFDPPIAHDGQLVYAVSAHLI